MFFIWINIEGPLWELFVKECFDPLFEYRYSIGDLADSMINNNKYYKDVNSCYKVD